MFISIKRKIGSLLSFIGFSLLLGMAGADDVAVLEGAHGPMLPLVLKGILFLSMMAVGAVLIGGASDESSN